MGERPPGAPELLPLRAAVVLAVIWASTVCPPSAAALEIQFDTRFDLSGFFDDPAVQDSLAQARAVFARIADELEPIDPEPGRSWSALISNPGGAGPLLLVDEPIPANTLVVFIGARPLIGALGFASNGTFREIDGDSAWVERVEARGQTGALEPSPVDFGPWGGTITINSNVAWSFDPTGPGPDQQDFLSTLVHEVGHLLGIGNAPSWSEAHDDVDFFGPSSAEAFGGPVPLDDFAAHWAEDTQSFVGDEGQEALMDPSTPLGVRQQLTELDWAGFEDIGWVIVPEPAGSALAFASLGALALLSRLRR